MDRTENTVTVRDYARQSRKQLDPAAFSEAAPEFFGTTDFWDMPADESAKAAIDIISLGASLADDIKRKNLQTNFPAIDRMCADLIKDEIANQDTAGLPPVGDGTWTAIGRALGRYVRVMLNSHFVAYITAYFQITFDDDVVTYCKYDFDFRRTVTEENMLGIRSAIRETAERTYGKPISEIRFIDKETYAAESNDGR